MVAPSQESIDAVYNFLNVHSETVIPRTINEDVITATVSVATAEKLLNTKYEDFKHLETGASITRCHEYSLPSELKGHVSLVGPTSKSFFSHNQMSKCFVQSCPFPK